MAHFLMLWILGMEEGARMKIALRLGVVAILAAGAYYAWHRRQAAEWNNRGFALLNEGRYEEGVAALERGRLANPNNAAIWKNLAQGYERLGQIDSAAAAYREALRLNPADNLSRQALAQFGDEQALRQRARQRVERLRAEGYSDDGTPLERIVGSAEESRALGNYPTAIALYERALFRTPDDTNIEARIEELERAMAAETQKKQ